MVNLKKLDNEALLVLVARALLDALDGENSHDLVEMTGMPEDQARAICEVRGELSRRFESREICIPEVGYLQS